MDVNAAKNNSTVASFAAAEGRQISAHKVLQEGSSVPVRVTRALGGGRFEGFVAGVKVNFSSERALKPGDVFTATVSGNGSKIFLTPQKEAGLAFQSSFNLVNLLNNPELSSDSLAASIVQMFTQTGLKIDSQLINRIKSIALRFGGKQKSAAEILVMLAEKGINAGEEEIKELLAQFSGELPWNNDAAEGQSGNNQEKLIKKINRTEGAWYLLPFELTDVKTVLGRGNIRLLFDSGKMLKLLNLDCNYKEKRYLFSISYEGGKCSLIRFNTGSDSEGEKQAAIELKRRFLVAEMTGFDICNAEARDLEGNASAFEELYTFGGEV